VRSLGVYLEDVAIRLACPSGPPLKLYTSGRTPVRAIAAVYSLILRGYSPAGVFLYGEYQWSPWTRDVFARALPFATVVPTEQVLGRAYEFGGPRLVDVARRYWFVMKSVVSLLCAPSAFCLIDDDVFVLDGVEDALAAFAHSDLVYIPDMDHSDSYLATWGWIHREPSLRTARFNAGLYWMRQFEDPRRVAEYALRVRPAGTWPWDWEQGFIASLYARRPAHELSGQRYFYPLFDGLPGGILGYDYAHNPCGFASVHFGGLPLKPDDETTLLLLPQILGPVAAKNPVAVAALAVAACRT
jgi:hypothetical protein